MIYKGNHLTRAVMVDGVPLNPCNGIASHSPDGFCWGYGGSGPAQLALAIMVKEFGPDLEQHPHHYQQLKWALISRLPIDQDFTICSDEVHKALQIISEKGEESS